MGSIEISAVTGDGPGPGEVVAGRVVAVPGWFGMLDEGVPWLRSWEELDRERARLSRMMSAVAAGGRSHEEMTDAERSILGTLRAYQWTFGDIDVPPMTREPEPVTGHAIRVQLGLAGRLCASRRPGWGYATGVLRWLHWITSAREEITYPVQGPQP